MVVGGVNTGNLEESVRAGASYAGIASGIFNKDDILQENEVNLKESVKAIEEKIRNL